MARADPSLWIVIPAMAREPIGPVLAAACGVVPPAQILIVSNDERTLATARRAGARALHLAEGSNLDDAATVGAAFARARGAQAILSLAADLPAIDSDDLDAMIDAFTGANLVLAPDEDRRGTHALLMAAGLIPYRHGPQSLWAHLDAARRAAVPFVIVPRDGLMRGSPRAETPAAARTRTAHHKVIHHD